MIKLTDEQIRNVRPLICEDVLDEMLRVDYNYLMDEMAEYEMRLCEIREDYPDQYGNEFNEQYEDAQEVYPVSRLYIEWNYLEDKTKQEKKELIRAIQKYYLRTSEEIKIDFLKRFEQMIIKEQLINSETITEIANIYIDELLN